MFSLVAGPSYKGPDSPPPLPLEIGSLTRLDQAIRCPICKDVFVAPVSLSCGHSYCSLCIRNALASNKKCGVCNEAAKEGDIRRNRSLEEVCDTWMVASLRRRASRPELIAFAKEKPRSLKPHPTVKRKSRSDSSTAQLGGRKSRKDSSPSVKRRKIGDDDAHPILLGLSSDMEPEDSDSHSNLKGDRGSDDDIDGDDQDMDRELEEQDIEVFEAESDDEIQVVEDPTDSTQIVPCPICQKRLLISQIDPHIGRNCKDPVGFLGTEKAKKGQVQGWKNVFGRSNTDVIPDGHKLTKLNASLTTDKDLRSELAKHELSTSGSGSVLSDRYAIWISLYNANLDRDLDKRKPLRVLRVQLEQEEKTFVRNKKDSKMAKELFDGGGAGEDREWASLIAQAGASRAKAAAAKAKAGAET